MLLMRSFPPKDPVAQGQANKLLPNVSVTEGIQRSSGLRACDVKGKRLSDNVRQVECWFSQMIPACLGAAWLAASTCDQSSATNSANFLRA
jgi:hypothetical protein